MALHRSYRRFAVATVTMLAGASIAQADAIDGDWCFAAQNLNIQGARIRTPAGTEMAGDYTRHAFTYTVPASELGAGTTVAMQLLSEETMALTRASGTAAAQPEVWKRCKPVS